MLGRSSSLLSLLTAGLITQVGCAQANLQPGDLAFCDTSDANAFPEPHLVINPVNRTIRALDVTYHLDDCSNAQFICLDGPITFIPFIQPRLSTTVGNSRIELRGNSNVRITALENGGSRIEISKREASRSLKAVYNYGAGSVLQSLELTVSDDGTTDTARYEPCR